MRVRLCCRRRWYAYWDEDGSNSLEKEEVRARSTKLKGSIPAFNPPHPSMPLENEGCTRAHQDARLVARPEAGEPSAFHGFVSFEPGVGYVADVWTGTALHVMGILLMFSFLLVRVLTSAAEARRSAMKRLHF
eukprot:6206919-Pleurochrysis_carterae.AAC.1